MTASLPRRIAWCAPWTWKRRSQIVAGLLLLLVGYPLSIGPAYGLWYWGLIPDEADVIYWPVEGLVYLVPAGPEWMDWYLSLFKFGN